MVYPKIAKIMSSLTESAVQVKKNPHSTKSSTRAVQQNCLTINWHLQLIAGAIRTTVNGQTVFTANKMMLGREILQPVDIMMGVCENRQPRVPSDYVEELEKTMSQVHTIARENPHNAQMYQKTDL
jgi:hypothetical protein